MTTQVITPKFQLGDCVKLSSGNQHMTISWLFMRPKIGKIPTNEYTGFVECSWFDGLQLQQKKFHQDALIKCEDLAIENVPQETVLLKTISLTKNI